MKKSLLFIVLGIMVCFSTACVNEGAIKEDIELQQQQLNDLESKVKKMRDKQKVMEKELETVQSDIKVLRDQTNKVMGQ